MRRKRGEEEEERRGGGRDERRRGGEGKKILRKVARGYSLVAKLNIATEASFYER